MKKRNIILIIVGAVLIASLIFGCIYTFCFYLPQKRERTEFERQVREYYENKISIYENENNAYADGEVDVVFLGDSLTDGCKLEKYYPGYVTVNRGIGGDTTYGLEERLQVSVYDLKPKVAVMLIGGNNISTMFDNYEDILAGFCDNLPNTKIILVSLTAMGGDWAHKNQLAAYNNVTIKKLAEKYGHAFVDVFTPLFNEKTGEIHAEYTNDGVHLTDLGYQVLSSAVIPFIEEALGKE